MPAEIPTEVSDLAKSDDIIVIVDHDGRIVLMTAAAEEFFGVEAADIAGEFVELLVPADRRWGHQAYRRGYIAEPSDREMDPGLEPQAERPIDGELVDIHVRLQPFGSGAGLFTAAHVSKR